MSTCQVCRKVKPRQKRRTRCRECLRLMCRECVDTPAHCWECDLKFQRTYKAECEAFEQSKGG